MRRGALVCLTGIDGAGKTTAARGLVEDLTRAGIPARYVYTRYVPFLLRPLIAASRLAFLRKRDAFRDYAGHTDAKRRATARHPLLARLYRAVMLADYRAQIFLKIAVPRALGKNLVCDRYVYDTVLTDLYVDFGYTLDEALALARRLMRQAPEPDLIVLVDIPPKVAFSRKDDVPSVAYLEERHAAYAALADAVGMHRVDGTRAPGVVREGIYLAASAALDHD